MAKLPSQPILGGQFSDLTSPEPSQQRLRVELAVESEQIQSALLLKKLAGLK